MRVEHLREFTVLAQTPNYTKAAEALCVTQPVLSRHIDALEGELGVRLLYRDTHSVALTVAETNGVSLVARGLTTVNWQGVACLPILDDGFELPVLLAYREDNDNPAIPQLLKSLGLQ